MLQKAWKGWQENLADFMGKYCVAWNKVTSYSGQTGELQGVYDMKPKARVKIRGLRLKSIE